MQTNETSKNTRAEKLFIELPKTRKRIIGKNVNYYNNVIRFIYDVVIDVPINKRQLPLYKGKRRLPKILSEKELDVFFYACDNYMYKTIFIMIYGSGLRISEATNLRVEDVDSENMRLFVRNGKNERERYTVFINLKIKLNNYFQIILYKNLKSLVIITNRLYKIVLDELKKKC